MTARRKFASTGLNKLKHSRPNTAQGIGTATLFFKLFLIFFGEANFFLFKGTFSSVPYERFE